MSRRVIISTELNDNTTNKTVSLEQPLVALTADNLELNSLLESNVVKSMTHVPELGLIDFLKRPVLLYVKTNVYEADLPVFSAWRTLVAAKLKGYKYFRGCCKLQIMYTGNPTCTGTTLISFYPKVDSTTSDHEDNATYSTPPYLNDAAYGGYTTYQLPHVQVNLEELCNNQFCLPFPNSNQVIDILTGNDWYIQIRPINSMLLNAGTTPDPINFEIYCSYEDVELYGPIRVQGAEIDNPRYLSRSLKFVSDIASSIGGQFMTPISLVAKYGAIVAEKMGFSRPVMPVMKQVITRAISSASYVTGSMDYSERLSIDPSSSVSINADKVPMGNMDDTNIKSVVSRWGCIGLNLSDDTVFVADPSSSAIAGTTIYTTPTSFVTALFRYWRGGLQFKFEFIGNALLRQRAVIYILLPGDGAPIAYNGNNTYLTTLVDICGRTEVVVDVPFFSLYKYNQVEPFIDANYSGLEYTRVYVKYISTTQGQAGTPSNIRFNAFIRAGADFEVSNPIMTNVDGLVVVQGKCNTDTFGEEIVDLLQLTRRSVEYINVDSSGSNYPIYGLPFTAGDFGPAGHVFPASTFCRSYASYIGLAYLGMRGGFRYKFIDAAYSNQPINGPTKYSLSLQLPGIDYADATIGSPLYISPNRVAEIEIPSQTISDFTFAARYYGRIMADKDMDVLVAYNGVNDVNYARVLVSSADDFTLRGFLCSPVLTRE